MYYPHLRRIERVFLALEERQHPYGARAWFARQAKVRPYSVSRWLHQPLRGRALAVLEQLEARAALSPEKHDD
jgi:hypothetical protein